MKTFKTSIDIAAPIDAVWTALTNDMPREPNPFGILRIDGRLVQNGRIALVSETAPNRTFALTVTAFDPPHGMIWRGGMPFGLFTGTRRFALSPMGAATRFDMQEDFAGLLSGRIVASMPDLSPSFEKFSHALKKKAEAHD